MPIWKTFHRDAFRKVSGSLEAWTLQELLAPQKVEFYSKSWIRLGNKHELCNDIGTTTGIDREIILGDDFAVSFASAAQKLSWAANRRTSRVEDMAYCLLGLLDVNMPVALRRGH